MKRAMLTAVGVLTLALSTILSVAPVSAQTLYEMVGSPTPGIPVGTKPDMVAYIKNGYKPVLIPSGKLTPSSTSFSTERGPDIKIPGCVQPPANFDPAKASAADLKKYGELPQGSMPKSKWLFLVAHAKTRDCTYYEGNGPLGNGLVNASQMYPSSIWTGKIADQNCESTGGGWGCNDYTHNWTEIDTDYYVNCGGYTPELTQLGNYGDSSEWVGLGGTTASDELQQAGIETQMYINTAVGTANNVDAFTEAVGSYNHKVYPNLVVTCGVHMYTKVYNGDCYYMGNLDLRIWYSSCDGTNATGLTAEAILERNGGSNVGLPNFTTTTFYGVGVTDGAAGNLYESMATAQHDYTNTYMDGGEVSFTGPLQNDPGDPPYDQYTLYNYSPCGGASSCL